MICFLDLGTSKISGVLMRRKETNSEIMAFSSYETSGIKRGSIVNIPQTTESIAKVLNHLEKQTGHKIKEIFVGLSGENISSTNSIGQAVISDKEVSTSDIQEALNLSSTMKVPSDKMLLDVVPNEYFIDGSGDIANPIGLKGVKLEVKTHVIYCSKKSIQNFQECLDNLGNLSARRYYFNQLGVAQCVLTEEEKKHGVCLIDIGAGTTDLSVYRNGSIVFSKILPYSGDYVTESIALSLQIPSRDAEEMKVRYGTAFADESDQELLYIKNDNEQKKISRKSLASIIEKSLSRILQNTLSTIKENGFEQQIPGGYVITGGTSNIEDMEKLAKKITGSNSRVGEPIDSKQESMANILKPEFSAVLGLTKFYALEQDKEFTFNQSKGIIARVLEWIRTEL